MAVGSLEREWVEKSRTFVGCSKGSRPSRPQAMALAAAADLDFVSLPDALELVLLLADDPKRLRRAALRWHARYCAEVPDVGFEEAHTRARLPGRPDWPKT